MVRIHLHSNAIDASENQHTRRLATGDGLVPVLPEGWILLSRQKARSSPQQSLSAVTVGENAHDLMKRTRYGSSQTLGRAKQDQREYRSGPFHVLRATGF